MHISEGVLSTPVIVSGWAVTSVITSVTLWKIKGEELPKTAVITSVFFVASLIHIPLGPFSAHLILHGLVGVILGYGAYPSIFLGLTLQAVLFQHGGITVIGINAVIMGIPAIISYWIFNVRIFLPSTFKVGFFGFAAGALATAFSGLLLALILITAGQAFVPAAKLALAAHFPVMMIEGAITAAAVSFLSRVRPETLNKGISLNH
jgi:cobalt/nickel transport system permease protein